ncbi:hypothetical protein [Streptococcus halichoeri]|uniref:hypothetical protein n=1 Tax=Streptococcus halichoeri TaxID=254785 RepID=UPI0013576CF9|nr:hypothetical protein [Streptococcus halichoeri]
MKRIIYLFMLLLSVTYLAACSNSSTKGGDFKTYIKNTDFKSIEHDSINNLYIVSQDLNTIISDENAINSFNDSIYDVLQLGLKTDKDIIFRGWDGNLASSLVYFDKDTFNQKWGVSDSNKIYNKSSGWQTISKFNQYLDSKNNSKTPEIEERLFELAMYSKK